MFIALDSAKNKVPIERAQSGVSYFCPVCNAPVDIRAKKSTLVQAHYAHKRSCPCLDNWKHDMSEWHLNWQKLFPEELREVVVLHNGEKHRADVLIGKTVIEFQHSSISGEEIAERNNFYLACGYKVVWVFDATDKLKHIRSLTIDPLWCAPSDLCWRRMRSQFEEEMPEGVTVYLEYALDENRHSNSVERDVVLIRTEELTEKGIRFCRTDGRIKRENFLKEYGILEKAIPSVTDMIKSFNQQLEAFAVCMGHNCKDILVNDYDR